MVVLVCIGTASATTAAHDTVGRTKADRGRGSWGKGDQGGEEAKAKWAALNRAVSGVDVFIG